MITCKICNEQFNTVSWKHLKKHNLTTTEYKNKYGDVVSDEYRQLKSKQSSGSNNPNFGKKHSNEIKERISELKKGTIPWNKGIPLSTDQKQKLSDKGKERNKKWREEGNHPHTGRIKSEKEKANISAGVKKKIKESIKTDPNKYKKAAQKATITKINNGYFTQKKKITIKKYIKKLSNWGYSAIESNGAYTVTHLRCNTTFTRVCPFMMHEKMCKQCNPSPGTSVAESELYNYIKSIYKGPIIQSDKTIFNNGFEIDILLPDLNIGIEYNGLYWHSELSGKSKWYHSTKYQKAKEKGIYLIQIFEDEWLYKKDIVKNRLLSKFDQTNTFYARKCVVKKIDSKIANDFLHEHHLQGKGYGTINYGLFYENKLMAVIKFSHLSRAKGFQNTQNCYELNRYASIGNVIGGAGKLFKRFITENNPEYIVSYADLRWNTGHMYEKIGMEFKGETTPGYWYINHDKRIHRFALRKNKDDDQQLTEWENRKQQGWNRIWDCGHAKYVWSKK